MAKPFVLLVIRRIGERFFLKIGTKVLESHKRCSNVDQCHSSDNIRAAVCLLKETSAENHYGVKKTTSLKQNLIYYDFVLSHCCNLNLLVRKDSWQTLKIATFLERMLQRNRVVLYAVSFRQIVIKSDWSVKQFRCFKFPLRTAT